MEVWPKSMSGRGCNHISSALPEEVDDVPPRTFRLFVSLTPSSSVFSLLEQCGRLTPSALFSGMLSGYRAR